MTFTVGLPGQSDVRIWDLIRKTMLRLTSDTESGASLWTPDGKRIVYASEGDGNIYWKAADGTGKGELLVSMPGKRLYSWAWSSNGKLLVLEDHHIGGNDDIGMVSMEGDRKWKPLLHEKYSERQPHVSLDGRWIAYTSNESGNREVCVRPFPDVEGGWWQVSTDGGENPLWSPNGRELFYRNGDAVMAVPVKTDPGFSYETPRVLFRGSFFSPIKVVGTAWEIGPDGRRFLMVKEMESFQSQIKINVVLNWLEELKQRVPVK